MGRSVASILAVLPVILAMGIAALTGIVIVGTSTTATLERLRLVAAGILVPMFQSVLVTLIAPGLVKATLTYIDNGQRLRHGLAPEPIKLFRW